MLRDEMIKNAAKHAAAGLELLNKILAVQSFAQNGFIHPSDAREEIIILSERYKRESEQAAILVERLLTECRD